MFLQEINVGIPHLMTLYSQMHHKAKTSVTFRKLFFTFL